MTLKYMKWSDLEIGDIVEFNSEKNDLFACYTSKYRIIGVILNKTFITLVLEVQNAINIKGRVVYHTVDISYENGFGIGPNYTGNNKPKLRLLKLKDE